MIVGVSESSDTGERRERTDQVGSDRIEAISSDCRAGGEPDEEDSAELAPCSARTRFGRPSFRVAHVRKSKKLRRRRTALIILYHSEPTDRHELRAVCFGKVPQEV